MGRTIGAQNKKKSANPLLSVMTVEERITLIANLIVEEIRNDQGNDCKLLKRLGGVKNESITTS